MIRSEKTNNLQISTNNLVTINKCDIPYLPILGIFITEFILPSIYYCYGIYYSYLVRNEYNTFHDGLWVTIIFIASRNITDPWSRSLCEYYEDRQENIHRILIFFSILLFAIGMFISISVGNFILQIIFLGGLGGITISLVETQIKFTTIDVFESDPKIFDLILSIARAISLLIMPILNLYLTDTYGISGAQLIITGIVLNVIPACFIMNLESKDNPTTNSLQRYRSFPGLEIQMKELNLKNDTSAQDTSSSSSVEELYDLSEETGNLNSNSSADVQTSTSDLTLKENTDIKMSNDILGNNQITIPVDVTTYYKNIGVNILPVIKEETEDDLNRISLKRLSRISTVLEELNENSRRNSFSFSECTTPSQYDNNHAEHEPLYLNKSECLPNLNNHKSINENHKQELHKEYKYHPSGNNFQQNNENSNHEQTQSISEDKSGIENQTSLSNETNRNNLQEPHSSKSFLKEVNNNTRSNCCCTPYRQYWFKRKVRNSKVSVLDNFLKPLYSSIKEIQFYPALTSKIFLTATSTIFITIIPFLPYDELFYDSRNNNQNKDSIFENEFNFMLCIVAFPWCFFMVFSPFLIKMSNIKIRIIFIVGLLLNSSSLFLLTISRNKVTLSCLLFGAGYGIISFCEEIVYRSLLGVRKWSKIHGTLDTISGIFIIVLYLFIYYFKFHLETLLNAAFVVYAFTCILWVATPITKYFVLLINNVFCNHSYYCNKDEILAANL